MVSQYLNQVRSLDELYAVMETDRLAAARLAESTFRNDVDAAIASIADISSVAGARVMADTHVASAKLLIDAEVASTRLAVGAEMAVAEYKRHAQEQSPPPDVSTIETAIQAIGKAHTDQLSQGARLSVEAIEREAAAAIARLKEIGSNAITEIRDFAALTSIKTHENAAHAAERLRSFRQSPQTLDAVAAEGDKAAAIVLEAAENAAVTLREAADVAFGKIMVVTDEACETIQAAAREATLRIEMAREKALTRIRAAAHLHIDAHRNRQGTG
jgi:hypothetical protein